MSAQVCVRWAALAVLSISGACQVTQDYSTPALELPAQYANAEQADTQAPPQEWWTLLGDSELDSLIERARAANLDLRLARARVREARALFDRARGTAGPQVDAQAGYAWQESSTNLGNSRFADSNPSELFQAGFDASWEIDLFGRNARAIEAARAGADSVLEDSRDVQISLFAELARNYVELRAAQRALGLTRDNLATQQDTLELVRTRAQAELASGLDVARAESQTATTRALLPQLEVRERAARHRIAVLLGLAPNALAAELAVPAPIPRAPVVTATGVPADLLRRRADVRRAERELAASAALSAQATAELFPRISLSAAFGLQSNSLSNLLDKDSQTFSVGPGLVAPIFHSGALRANVRVQDARQEQALARYEATALVALREVEDALVARDRERTRLEALLDALTASRRALEFARETNRGGLVDYFDVLDAQRAVLETESAVAASEAELCAQTIAVYKALGGGWQN